MGSNEILGALAGGISKIIASSSKKKARKKPIADLPKSSFDYVKEAKSEFFSVGFAKKEIMPDDMDKKRYYVAGYRTNNPATGVLDPMMTRAMWIDDQSGHGGIVMVTVDCIGLMNHDVEIIRNSLEDFKKRTGCRSINICSTHDHASIDTMGYWGHLPKSGRDKKYMEILHAGVKAAVEEAYDDRREGKLYWGGKEADDIQKDSRLPHVYSKILTRLRFVPNDGSREAWLLHFTSHSESLTGKNSLVSADFPAYIAKEIEEKCGAQIAYFVGAIGGLIMLKELDEDPIKSTYMAGESLAKTAMSIDNEKELKPRISIITQEFYAHADNPILLAAAAVKIMIAKSYATGKGELGRSLKTEVSYIEIDDFKAILLPGEIYSELVYGGYLSAEESAEGKDPSINPVPLKDIVGDEDVVVFGLSNDEIGYIIPPNDFMLNPTTPYLNNGTDSQGRRHYEETNGLGPNIAGKIAEVMSGMMEEVKKAKNN